MLSVFLFNENMRHDSNVTISLSVNKNEEGNDLIHEFVKSFDTKERKVGLNNVEFLHLYEVLPTLRNVLVRHGLDNPLSDYLAVVEDLDSMTAVTIDYLL